MTPDEIYALRATFRETQRQFGERLGFSPAAAESTVCRLENGTRTARGLTLKALLVLRAEQEARKKSNLFLW